MPNTKKINDNVSQQSKQLEAEIEETLKRVKDFLERGQRESQQMMDEYNQKIKAIEAEGKERRKQITADGVARINQILKDYEKEVKILDAELDEIKKEIRDKADQNKIDEARKRLQNI